MAKTFVKCLLFSAIFISFLILFWIIFESIKLYEKTNEEIQHFLHKSLVTSSGELQKTIDGLLDKRLSAMEDLLRGLAYGVVLALVFVSTLLEHRMLTLSSAVVMTTALVLNLLIRILIPDIILVISVIVCTLCWLFFDLQ